MIVTERFGLRGVRCGKRLCGIAMATGAIQRPPVPVVKHVIRDDDIGIKKVGASHLPLLEK